MTIYALNTRSLKSSTAGQAANQVAADGATDNTIIIKVDSPRQQVENFLYYAQPPLINQPTDVQYWEKQVQGVKNMTEATILGELIRSGVVTQPSDVKKYESLWRTKFVTARTLTELQTPAKEFDLMETISFNYVKEELANGYRRSGSAEKLLRSIRDRKVLTALLASEAGDGLRRIIFANWPEIGQRLGQIIYDEDKLDYHNLLGKNLSRSHDRTAFYAPIMLIDLSNLDREILPAKLQVIDDDRVLILMDHQGDLKAGVINPRDQSTIKHFFRSLSPEQSQYLLYYFPKMEKTEDGWEVSMAYESREGLKENLIGKDDYDNNLFPAAAKFWQAFSLEDLNRQESSQTYRQLISPELLAGIKAEPAPRLKGIFKLMMIMAARSCREEAPDVFGLTSEQYAVYEKRIVQLLEQGREFSREEFLVEAIKLCDGRAALAAVIAYNLLMPLGEIGHNSLFLRFPKAFRMIPDLQDQAGGIYHYFGCFFAAYSLQRWLVDGYHSSKLTAEEIKQRAGEIKSAMKINWRKERIEGINAFELLQLVQYDLLKIGDKQNKEIMSLAGVMFEEVVSDHDISQEVFEDIKGISGGHAFYELVSGERLSVREKTRKFFVRNVLEVITKGGAGLKQKLLLLPILFCPK